MTHDIFTDTAGWGNYPRLTCLSCGATLLKKPYMNTAAWAEAVKNFSKEHCERTAFPAPAPSSAGSETR